MEIYKKIQIKSKRNKKLSGWRNNGFVASSKLQRILDETSYQNPKFKTSSSAGGAAKHSDVRGKGKQILNLKKISIDDWNPAFPRTAWWTDRCTLRLYQQCAHVGTHYSQWLIKTTYILNLNLPWHVTPDTTRPLKHKVNGWPHQGFAVNMHQTAKKKKKIGRRCGSNSWVIGATEPAVLLKLSLQLGSYQFMAVENNIRMDKRTDERTEGSTACWHNGETGKRTEVWISGKTKVQMDDHNGQQCVTCTYANVRRRIKQWSTSKKLRRLKN